MKKKKHSSGSPMQQAAYGLMHTIQKKLQKTNRPVVVAELTEVLKFHYDEDGSARGAENLVRIAAATPTFVSNTDPPMRISPFGDDAWWVDLGFRGLNNSGDWWPRLKDAKAWARKEYNWRQRQRKKEQPKRIMWKEEPCPASN